MRVDKLLSKLCLIKTRSIVKNACDKKLVKINGKIAKASATIVDNDIIEYELYGYYIKIKITELDIKKGIKRLLLSFTVYTLSNHIAIYIWLVIKYAFNQRARNISPVRSSTQKYLIEIGTLHLLHLPPSINQLNNGIFSYHLIL